MIKRLIILIMVLPLFSGCAMLSPDFEEPKVRITHFKPISSGNMSMRFAIGLHVSNPNDTELALRGVVYNVVIEGHDVINGVSNDLPVIPAFGESSFELEAEADLLASMSLIADLLMYKRDTFNYQLNTRLDVGEFFPDIRIEKSGDIDLRDFSHR